MKQQKVQRRRLWLGCVFGSLAVVALVVLTSYPGSAEAGGHRAACCNGDCDGGPGCVGELGGTWYWLHSPDEEKRVVMGLYNRYCIRCHGVDGRGVWDIPDVPNFTNPVWQGSRSDGELARIIIEGRGAVMPPFRGTLSVEEAWGMARYLRTFMPGTETSRPDLTPPAKVSTTPASARPSVQALPAVPRH